MQDGAKLDRTSSGQAHGGCRPRRGRPRAQSPRHQATPGRDKPSPPGTTGAISGEGRGGTWEAGRRGRLAVERDGQDGGGPPEQENGRDGEGKVRVASRAGGASRASRGLVWRRWGHWAAAGTAMEPQDQLANGGQDVRTAKGGGGKDGEDLRGREGVPAAGGRELLRWTRNGDYSGAPCPCPCSPLRPCAPCPTPPRRRPDSAGHNSDPPAIGLTASFGRKGTERRTGPKRGGGGEARLQTRRVVSAASAKKLDQQTKQRLPACWPAPATGDEDRAASRYGAQDGTTCPADVARKRKTFPNFRSRVHHFPYWNTSRLLHKTCESGLKGQDVPSWKRVRAI